MTSHARLAYHLRLLNIAHASVYIFKRANPPPSWWWSPCKRVNRTSRGLALKIGIYIPYLGLACWSSSRLEHGNLSRYYEMGVVYAHLPQQDKCQPKLAGNGWDTPASRLARETYKQDLRHNKLEHRASVVPGGAGACFSLLYAVDTERDPNRGASLQGRARYCVMAWEWCGRRLAMEPRCFQLHGGRSPAASRICHAEYGKKFGV